MAKREWENPIVKRDREERKKYREEKGEKLERYYEGEDRERTREYMTRDARENLIEQIMNAGGDTDVLTPILQSLRDNWDGWDEDRERYYTEYDRLYDRYDELQKQNLDLFWRAKADERIESQAEDVKRDGTKQSYEELFEKREG